MEKFLEQEVNGKKQHQLVDLTGLIPEIK